MRRRTFLQTAAAGTAAIALPARLYGRVIGANDQLRIAVIGLRGRGKDHLSGFGDNVVAVCDCDREVLAAAAPEKKLMRFVDYRELLAADGIDAVSIATPNHTHAIIAIAAIRAGKDVYVEKPVSHNVWEGRQTVEAARRHQAIVQCGTQSRSSSALQQALHFVRRGELGRPKFAIGTCYKPRRSIGKLDQPLAIPSSIDYELWCGPAELRDLYRPQLHYDWHWDFNTGNGDMGNQGIHQMDLARWFLGENRMSRRVFSVGGRLGYEDAGDTPNTQTVLHEFERSFLIFETRGLPASKAFQKPDAWSENMDHYRGCSIGVIVEYEEGHLLIPNYTAAVAFDSDGNEIRRWEGGGDHYGNFIHAVRADERALLTADIEAGHISSALCHTGNVSHRLGTHATLDEVRSQMPDRPEFADSLQRMAAHLSANGINLTEPVLTLGADLRMDAVGEVVLDNSAANELLSREYRQPFEIAAGP
jgi:predicted dehydrogenase